MFTKFVMKLMSSVRAIARWEAHRLCNQMDTLAEKHTVEKANLRTKLEAAEELKQSEIKAAEDKAERTAKYCEDIAELKAKDFAKKMTKKAEAHNSLTCAIYPLISKEL